MIWLVIGLVMLGPMLGFLTIGVGSGSVVGAGVDLKAISPQIQSIFAGGNLTDSHTIAVPVYNQWFFPINSELSLTLISDGRVIYKTPVAKTHVSPFQSGELLVTMRLPQSVVSQIQGTRVEIGGQLTFGAPVQLWSFTLSFPRG